MTYIHGTIKDYLRDLAARTSAPGGGSAAALTASMAAALVVMASRYAIGKGFSRSRERRMEGIAARSLKAQARLEALVDLDVKAYASGDLGRSIAVPAEVARLSWDVVRMAEVALASGNKNLSTDAALGLSLAAASFIAALSYVEVNIRWAKNVPARYKTRARGLRKNIRKVLAAREKAEAALGSSFGR